MATNDNRAMVEAAREFFKDFLIVQKMDSAEVEEITTIGARFAISQSALAVAAERTRVINEIGEMFRADDRLEPGYEAGWNAAVTATIDKLRGATDE